jgi:ABC-type sugar transport system permease subunit
MTLDAGSPPGDSSDEVLVAPSGGGVATIEVPSSGGDPAAGKKRKIKKGTPGEKRWISAIFLFPAAVFLSAIVFYPFIYTIVRSFFHDSPTGNPNGFAGLSNYGKIFSDPDAFRSLKNNLVWVIIVPAVATMLGLMFAVLTERIRWAAAFKIVLFMPLAISFVAAGVTWSLVYADQPSRGLANTLVVGVHDIFNPTTSYPGVKPAPAVTGPSAMTGSASAGFTSGQFSASQPALLPMTGLSLTSPPSGLEQAAVSTSGSGIHGAVWNDFKLGGGGTKGQIDHGELGLKGVTVQALQNGKVVGSTTTAADGSFSFPKFTSGSYSFRLPGEDFGSSFTGWAWLGSTSFLGVNFITLSIIIAYLWMYTGFCMVLLAAGMAAIPRDALEAARMDGATELQVFRRVTAPLLAPVLMVVFVTMVINVLKIFDIVFIISQSAGANQKYASVLAVQLYNDYGNQQYGAASAVGVALVILVIPAMIFQIYRFRKDQR